MGKNKEKRRGEEVFILATAVSSLYHRCVLKGAVLNSPQSPDVVLLRGTFPHRQ